MALRNIEIVGDIEGGVEIKRKGMESVAYGERDTWFTEPMLEKIKANYPEAFSKLEQWYEKRKLNKRYFEYSIVLRFCRCNFIHQDDILDIDNNGYFHFEFPNCPIAGECKYHNVVCRPKFKSTLSDREYDVMKLVYLSLTNEAIADELLISIETVKKHRANALQSLGLHSTPEFIVYASVNRMFHIE